MDVEDMITAVQTTRDSVEALPTQALQQALWELQALRDFMGADSRSLSLSDWYIGTALGLRQWDKVEQASGLTERELDLCNLDEAQRAELIDVLRENSERIARANGIRSPSHT